MSEKRVNTTFAADVFITNCGGSILWLETEDGETVKIQEERTDFNDGTSRFGRVYSRELQDDNGEMFLTFRGTMYYMSQFYNRFWGR